MNQNLSPIACRLESLSEEQRQREKALLKFVREATLEIHGLTEGYGLRFPNDSARVLLIAEFITLERLCCPFFNFELHVEAEGGPVWLRPTAQHGVKQFLTQILTKEPEPVRPDAIVWLLLTDEDPKR